MPKATPAALAEQHYRDALTGHLRRPDSVIAPVEGDSEGLAVYRRLIRNNLHNFLDRCFTQARELVGAQVWQAAKEDFVGHGQAHSPLFSDIPAQFLAHHRERDFFDLRILEVMDAECRELAAEIALDNENLPSIDAEQLAATSDADFDRLQLRLTPGASLAEYAHCVYEDEVPEKHSLSLIWRDEHDRVQHAELSPADFQLLQQIASEPESLNDLLAALSQYLPDIEAQRPQLRRALRHWSGQGVLRASHAL